MRFDQLNANQRAIANALDLWFMRHKTYSKYDFSMALAFLLNKYKKVR